MTLSITTICRDSECHATVIVMLNVVMPSVTVHLLLCCVILLSVMAPLVDPQILDKGIIVLNTRTNEQCIKKCKQSF
jgi:hypothetical protein